MSKVTVFDHLTAPNPEVDVSHEATGGNTKSHSYTMVRDSDVTVWHDFNLETIRAAFGDLLQLAMSEEDESAKEVGPPLADELVPNSQRAIFTEVDVDRVCEAWCTRVVRGGIKRCADTLRDRLGLDRQAAPSLMRRGVTLKGVDQNGGTCLFLPDWAVFSRKPQPSSASSSSSSSARVTQLTYVVGDSKLDAKWRSSWLDPDAEQLTLEQKKESVWPLRQLATYCRSANTRYGFVITMHELVVFRAHDLPSLGTQAAGLEYRAVPWENGGGDGQLTVNLAIWALSMMALNDQFRGFVDRASGYDSLGAWRRTTARGEEESGEPATLRHVLSGRLRDEMTLRAELGDQLVVLEAGGGELSVHRPPARRSSQRLSRRAATTAGQRKASKSSHATPYNEPTYS